MEKYTKRFSVEEVQEILNKHMGVKDTRIHCLTSHNGINWDGIEISVYDENTTKSPTTTQQNSTFCKIAKDKLREIQNEEHEIMEYIQKNIDCPWTVPYNYSAYYRDSIFSDEQNATDFENNY